jgi:segregation and condensation protein A
VNAANSYEIKLDSFEGPLDLLLHLVVKHEMDIYDIPIVKITEQYLFYLEQMEAHNIDVASEFLLMAATLIHIKSKMLLPVPPIESADELELDPRVELVHRLLEYQRYKEGAQQLDEYPQLERDVFSRPENTEPDTLNNTVATDATGEVGLFELVQALRGVLARVDEPQYHEVYVTDFTVAEAGQRLRALLVGREHLPFNDCFSYLPRRLEIVVMFIAVLECVKLQRCKIVQLNPRGVIYIYPVQTENCNSECAS